MVEIPISVLPFYSLNDRGLLDTMSKDFFPRKGRRSEILELLPGRLEILV